MPFVINNHKVKSIFIHCSASEYGDVLRIDRWHKRNGFSMVGYQAIILNGKINNSTDYWPHLDGQIQPGRPLDTDLNFSSREYGAHVRGRNSDSLGICVIGKKSFTDLELESTKRLCMIYMNHFELDIPDILGHYEDPNTHKTCPNWPMNDFRDFVSDKVELSYMQDCIRQRVKEIYG